MIEHKLPDKLTFKRNEVVKITKLNGKVIDYWENEFKAFKPITNPAGEVFYTRKDVENILTIKHLLINEKKSKESVGKYFNREIQEIKPAVKKDFESVKPEKNQLEMIKQVLKDILTIIDKNVKN